MDNPTFHLEGIVRTRDEMQDFSGPLSLILMLLSKNKIEIRDLKISEILEQYLDHISKMQELDLEIASEFVQMASHLVYIKTRTLLAGDEEVSELEELMTSLEQLKCQDAYLSIKAVTPELFSASVQGMLLFSKEAEPLRKPGNSDYQYSHKSLELLLSLASVLTRGAKQNLHEDAILVPRRIIFNVREKSSQLVNLLRAKPVRSLKELYSLSSSRSELVATFICVLDLCATGNLLVCEEDGELVVKLCGDGDIEFSDSIFEQETNINE